MKTGRMMAGAGWMDVISVADISFANIANQRGLYLQAVQWRRRINV